MTNDGPEFRARAAMLSAGHARMRPVLMTATAMILGMLPMALGLGEGGEQNAPLGRAVIGGLMFATVTTLFVVPIIYYLSAQEAAGGLPAQAGGTGAGSALMRYTEPDPQQTRPPETVEEKLRRENRELKRQLEELRGPAHAGAPRNLWHPSAITIWAIFLGAVVAGRGGIFRRLHSAAEAAGRGLR